MPFRDARESREPKDNTIGKMLPLLWSRMTVLARAAYLFWIDLRLCDQKEATMNDTGDRNRDLETLASGMLLTWCGIWWGILEPGQLLPEGMGAIGIGLILLGINAVRALKGIPIYLFSMTFGLLFLILGGLRLARLYLRLPPFELSICGLFLIVLGTSVLMRELLRDRKTGFDA